MRSARSILFGVLSLGAVCMLGVWKGAIRVVFFFVLA